MSNIVSLKSSKQAQLRTNLRARLCATPIDAAELSRRFEACRSDATASLLQTILSLESMHLHVRHIVGKVRDRAMREELLTTSASVTSLIELARTLARRI